MTSILITRPRTLAGDLLAALRQHGYETVLEPMLKIVPNHQPHPKNIKIDALVLTSKNAVLALEQHRAEMLEWLTLPCFCVGPHTALAAEAYGFRNLFQSAGDSVDLAALIKGYFGDVVGCLLHICGTHVTDTGFAQLRQDGFEVMRWPVYQAEAATVLSDELQQWLLQGRLQAALFYSPRTATIFTGLIQRYKLEACCASLSAIGLSAAVAEAWQPLTWRHTAIATTPTEAAMIEALRHIHPAL